MHGSECNGTRCTVVKWEFYPISRDANPPIKSPDFNAVLYNNVYLINILSCRVGKRMCTVWQFFTMATWSKKMNHRLFGTTVQRKPFVQSWTNRDDGGLNRPFGSENGTCEKYFKFIKYKAIRKFVLQCLVSQSRM